MFDDQATGWQRQASCRGEDSVFFFAPAYFEKRGEKLGREAIAKRICATCPVQAPCLEYALATNQDSGVWGGTSEEERRKLRKLWLARQRRAS